MNMAAQPEKRFTLTFPDGRSVLTCNFQGAALLPASLVWDGQLDALEVGAYANVFINDQLFVWERIA